MRAPLVVLVLALAGCASEPPAGIVPPGPEEGGADPAALVAPTFREPLRLGRVDSSGAEPSILVTKEGVVFVAAAPHLWRSLDRGASFEEIDSSALDAFDGDVDLAADANGTLYYVGLDQDGRSVPFQVSRDLGATWSKAYDVSEGHRADRQWIDVLTNGSVVINWRDHEQDPEELRARVTLDGGATWEPIRYVAPDTIHGPPAHDAEGAIYFAYYQDGLRVARSRDAGATWTHHQVTEEARDTTLRSGRPIDMFPVVAVDAAGVVYLAWAADPPGEAPLGSKEVTVSRVWLAVSNDVGETWSAPRAISPEGQTSIFPWIVAGRAGHVALTWYQTRVGAPGHLTPDAWDVALVESADGGGSFLGGVANREPVHLGAICRSGGGCSNDVCLVLDACVPSRMCEDGMCIGRDRSRLEFFEMALLPDGHPIVAWVADAEAPDVGIEIHVGGVAEGTPLV